MMSGQRSSTGVTAILKIFRFIYRPHSNVVYHPGSKQVRTSRDGIVAALLADIENRGGNWNHWLFRLVTTDMNGDVVYPWSRK
jgi:hypothetical protein